MSQCLLIPRPKCHYLAENCIQHSPDGHPQTWPSGEAVLTMNLKRDPQLWLVIFSSHRLSGPLTKFAEIGSAGAAQTKLSLCVRAPFPAGWGTSWREGTAVVEHQDTAITISSRIKDFLGWGEARGTYMPMWVQMSENQSQPGKAGFWMTIIH